MLKSRDLLLSDRLLSWILQGFTCMWSTRNSYLRVAANFNNSQAAKNTVQALRPAKTEETDSHRQNKKMWTPPVRSNLCTPLIAVWLLRGAKSQRRCPKSNCWGIAPQQENPPSSESPGPPPSSWSLTKAVSEKQLLKSKTNHPATRVCSRRLLWLILFIAFI